VARSAVAAGIGWFILNRRVDYLDALRRQQPGLPVGCVTPDQEEIGPHPRAPGAQAGARRRAAAVRPGPPDTSAAQDRLRTTQAGLADASFRWTVVNGDWTEGSGESAVAAWLRLTTAERPALVVARTTRWPWACGVR